MAAAGAGAAEAPLKMLLPRFLPYTLFGRPIDRLPHNVQLARNKAIYALGIEATSSLFSLPLGAIRSGIAKLSTGLNVTLIVVSVCGLLATAKLNHLWIMAHAATVWGLVGIFCLYVLLTILFGQGSGEDGNWVILLVFAFVVVDVVVGFYTANLAWLMYKDEKAIREEDRAGGAGGAAGAGGGADAAERGRVRASESGTDSEGVSPSRVVLRPGVETAAAAAAGPAPVAGWGDGSGGAGAAAAGVDTTVPPPIAAEGTPVGVTEAPEGKECVVCLEKDRDVLIYRCGHVAVCSDCGERLRRQGRPCPICRGVISDIVKVFK